MYRENVLLKYLTQEEKEIMWTERNKIEADLQFLPMLIGRNTIGKFQYEIYPTFGICRNFLKHLFERYYVWNIKESDLLLTEYMVAKKYITYIYDEETIIKEDFIEIRNYFIEKYDMKIEDYIGDFIGCSHGCGFVRKEIYKIININKEEK